MSAWLYRYKRARRAWSLPGLSQQQLDFSDGEERDVDDEKHGAMSEESSSSPSEDSPYGGDGSGNEDDSGDDSFNEDDDEDAVYHSVSSDSDISSDPNPGGRPSLNLPLDTTIYPGGPSLLDAGRDLVNVATASSLTREQAQAVRRYTASLLPEDSVFRNVTFRQLKTVISRMNDSEKPGYSVLYSCPRCCTIWPNDADETSLCTGRFQEKGKSKPRPWKPCHEPMIVANAKRFWKRSLKDLIDDVLRRGTVFQEQLKKGLQVDETPHVENIKQTKLWKEKVIDSKFDTENDGRNIVISFAADGYCPFSKEGNTYSMWPFLVFLLNLPEEERFKPENILL